MIVDDLIAGIYAKIPEGHPGGISQADAGYFSRCIREFAPEFIFEIGCAAGVSTSVIHAVCLANNLDQVEFVSYDISDTWYGDRSKATGFLMENLLEKKLENFELILGKVEWKDARSRLKNAKGKKLVFIDANHFHPFPMFDTLNIFNELNDGDMIVYHDVGEWADETMQRGDGALFIWENYKEDLKVSNEDAPNIGAVIFERKAMIKALQKTLRNRAECPLTKHQRRLVRQAHKRLNPLVLWVKKLCGITKV